MNITVDAWQLGELQKTLNRYAEVSRKGWEDILAKEGREVAFGLYSQLKKISPTPQGLLASAQARKWRMGRVGNRFVPDVAGWVSRKAHDRAEELLTGQPSDYFRVRTTGQGTLIVRRVRFSQRRQNKRRTQLSRVLTGGRKNNRYAAGVLRAKDVSKFELSRALKGNTDIKRLNLGSLAAAIELGYRQRAALGGTTAYQWLPKVYARRSSKLVKRGPLVVNARGGYQMGRVDFVQGKAGLEGISLMGRVPGTDKVLQRHDILSAVFSARIADRQAYITRKLQQAKEALR